MKIELINEEKEKEPFVEFLLKLDLKPNDSIEIEVNVLELKVNEKNLPMEMMMNDQSMTNIRVMENDNVKIECNSF